MNAIQGVDAALGAFTTGIDAAVNRMQATTAREALAHEASGWESAQEWQQYADNLERDNARLAQELAQLKRDHLQFAERTSNMHGFFVRYTAALTARINELDEMHQRVSASMYAYRQESILSEALGAKCSDRYPKDAALQRAAHVDEFMRSRNVKLGVPSAIDFMRK